MPMYTKPRSDRIDAEKKSAFVMSEPALPPAPTIPETTPSAGRETYGTTPYVRPSDICTQSEKKRRTMTTVARRPELETQSSPFPYGAGGSESTTF